MPLEDIPAFQEQMRYDITSATMRVYHPRKSDIFLGETGSSGFGNEVLFIFECSSIDHHTVYVITARKPLESGQSSTSASTAK